MGIYGSYKVHLRLIPVVRAWVDSLVLWKVQVKYYYSPHCVSQMESTQEMSGQFVYRELCIVCKNKQNQL